MRIIGLDIHRAFAEAVAWNNGKLSRLGRVTMRREQLEEFAKQLSNSDIFVIEATGNAACRQRQKPRNPVSTFPGEGQSGEPAWGWR
jgi:hypothetical protein